MALLGCNLYIYIYTWSPDSPEEIFCHIPPIHLAASMIGPNQSTHIVTAHSKPHFCLWLTENNMLPCGRFHLNVMSSFPSVNEEKQSISLVQLNAPSPLLMKQKTLTENSVKPRRGAASLQHRCRYVYLSLSFFFCRLFATSFGMREIPEKKTYLHL